MRLNNTYGRCLKRALLVTEEKMKKKVGIILLISLLVISSVFASTFTGKARLRLGAWNSSVNNWAENSSKYWEYGFQDKSEAELKFILQELIGSTTGEGKYFAEVEAAATARLKAGDDWSNFSGEWDATKNVQFKVQFNKANIVFDKDKNFKLGINGTWNQPRYARGWEVEFDNGNLIQSDPFFTYVTAFESYNHIQYNATASCGWIPGITLSYDKFAFSFALDGNRHGNPVNDPGLVALFQANNLTVMDGMNVSVAAGYMQSNTMEVVKKITRDNNDKVTAVETTKVGSQRHILFGFGLNYASDLVKFDLGVNGNYNVDKEQNAWTHDGYRKPEINEAHGVEASINFAYLGDVKVNFDAWFLDNLGLWSDANVPTFVTMGNQFDLGLVYRNDEGHFFRDDEANPYALHKALSMQLGVQPIDALKINVRAQDILNQLIIGADFPISITDAITLTPTFEYTNDTEKTYTKSGWKNDGKANSIIQGALQFNYKHDLFNLFASVRVGTETQATTKSGKGTPIHVRPYLKISSDALVDNLILSLVWEKATFGNQADSPAEKYYSLHTKDQTQNFGDIYLEARINF